jgi:sarcosine oxidase subunit alpha
VFENNDLPGAMLASAAQRLLHLDHCKFAGAAVVVTDNDQGYRVAQQLAASATKIAAIVDIRETPRVPNYRMPEGSGIFTGQTLMAAEGRGHVSAAVIGSLSGQQKKTVACRWIVQAVGFTPANSLLYQNGCKLRYDTSFDHAIVTQHAPRTHSAGSVNGFADPHVAALDGRRAGLAAALSLNPQAAELTSHRDELAAQLQALPVQVPALAHYVSASPAKKKFVCLCEDVTEKDLCDAVAEGYSNIETLKRYSTVSMGPCQGKMCQSASIAICARENGQSIEQTGVTTARPPEQPLPLGLLAGRALQFSLIRRTPMHDWHLRNGATMMDAGNWKRPQMYTTPEEEYTTVRERAGLIDSSTLGKIEFRGRDVVQFLHGVGGPFDTQRIDSGRVS